MGDDVVEHLSAVDIFEKHVPMVVGPHDVLHAADIRMVEESDYRCLSRGSYLFGTVGPFSLTGASVFLGRVSGDDLHGGLYTQWSAKTGLSPGRQRASLTCSPVSMFFASFTLPILPAPMVFPRAHWPVGVLIVVRRLGCEASDTPLAAAARCCDA
jgi:hypothetical protein